MLLLVCFENIRSRIIYPETLQHTYTYTFLWRWGNEGESRWKTNFICFESSPFKLMDKTEEKNTSCFHFSTVWKVTQQRRNLFFFIFHHITNTNVRHLLVHTLCSACVSVWIWENCKSTLSFFIPEEYHIKHDQKTFFRQSQSLKCTSKMHNKITHSRVFINFFLKLRPQISQDYPLNLSISISGGKETNKDSPSNGEWRGNSSNLKSPRYCTLANCSLEKHFRGCPAHVQVPWNRASKRVRTPLSVSWHSNTKCSPWVRLFGNAAENGW